MKERPILFSAPMVRAILEGRKTQTRRIAKVLLPGNKHFIMAVDHFEWVVKRVKQCPYGQPGDRLWVRETWATINDFEDMSPSEMNPEDAILWWMASDADNPHKRKGRWRSSIHMPRWASRITLEVTGVRVERLCDISEADAIAEGIQPFPTTPSNIPRLHYSSLWEKINGPGSWEQNPFVWVIEFTSVPCSHKEAVK